MDGLPKYNYNLSLEIDPYEEKLKEISYSGSAPLRTQEVVLVIPPSPQVPTPGREFLITGPFEGFTYIATLVKKMGYRLKVVDCRLEEDPVGLVLEGVKTANIVGIASYCDSFVFLRNVTAMVKEKYPGKPIFLGGPLVTSLPEVILENTSADLAVLGEAELTLIELLDVYFFGRKAGLEMIKGVAYKDGGTVRVNPHRPQIKNLDNLPLLDYTVWPNYESIVKNGQILISSTRGCTQECSFCFKTIPRLRLKSIERFRREVAYLKKVTKFDYTWLNDLTFNVIEERAIKICRILKEYDVRYHCFARVQKVSKELVKTLKDTGCLGIWFGIESYEQSILDANRKNISIADIDIGVQTAIDAGLSVRGLFIVGLYGETEGSLKRMVDFIKKSRFLPLVKYLVPFPGTSLYRYACDSGKIKDVVEFLEMLSERKVSDNDDKIINLTGLQERVLRDYFHQVWNITKEREPCFE